MRHRTTSPRNRPDPARARRRNASRQRRTRRTVENAEVARIFREIAELLEIEGANPFRVRAYRGAARTVEELPEPVATLAADPARLTELPGIGEDLAGKIVQITRTGTLPMLGELEHEAPRGAAELMRVPGLGPKRAKALCERLGIRSLGGLERAARMGRIRALPGFGEKTERKILDELAARGAEEHRMLRSVAAQYAEALLAYVRALDGVRRAEIAGSYRRCRETVGDLDILVCCAPRTPVVAHFCGHHEVARVLARGPTRASVRLRSGLQVDLRVLAERSFGAGLHYFTGSKAHNIAVRRLGQQRGLKINEYGVFHGERWTGGRDEADVFAAVELPWIPPELREDRGELDAARDGTLPHLVELGDIRGDLQMHTTDSDGRDTLDAMAEAAEALGYEYLAITDHSPSVRIAGGLDRAGFRRQMRRIERLNAKRRSLTILAGAEVDILADGSLDLDDDTLAALDLVVVSLHSRLELPVAEQTRRVLRALEHPSVDILAHPTGRLIGRRRGAALDLDTVCRAAVRHGVMLEVNGQPERLDLDDVAARAAVAHGVRLVIDTDAHATAELRFMRWGVDQARRGWVTAAHVANTLRLAKLRPLLHGARS
ncbi:MAG TPA: DNA polymerase/3'-5' exonuclease PolX [Gemmatimonadaceae bacterium]|nr:DNA polymerase/3'-5' exonuclease PolX [Gemmatimonadaceae bacterium]